MMNSINARVRVYFDMSDVARVYAGKAGACMCGCKGRYWTTPERRAEQEARRGYAYEERDINTRQVAKILSIVANAQDVEYETGLSGEEIISAEQDGKVYVVYFSKPAVGRKAVAGDF